jgi:hypothetical protein
MMVSSHLKICCPYLHTGRKKRPIVLQVADEIGLTLKMRNINRHNPPSMALSTDLTYAHRVLEPASMAICHEKQPEF